jgi:hypothetical protein
MMRNQSSSSSSCDSTGNESMIADFKNKRGGEEIDDDSIYSTSSSVTSTSSKISKMVKNLISNESSFKSKLKRSTIHLFSRKQQQQQQQQQQTSLVKSKRRNSVINLASRFLNKNNTASSSLPSINFKSFANYDQVGSLLDDYQVGNFLLDLDTKSDQLISTNNNNDNEPWIRQRAKSCQDHGRKSPMLKHLATKGSCSKLSIDSSSTDHTPTTDDLPVLFTKGITTFHTRLMNECDRILSLFVLPNTTDDIQLPLLTIISDLYKLIDMVNWHLDTFLKDRVQQETKELEQTILQEDGSVPIKEIVKSILI